MTTVVYLDKHRPKQPEPQRGRLPITQFLNDLSRDAGELADDWLFQSVSEPVKRQMLAERGIAVAA